MSLFLILPITEELRAKASALTPQLRNKQKSLNVEGETVLFKYQWTDGWSSFVEEFWSVKVRSTKQTLLLKLLTMIKKEDVQRELATSVGAEIPKVKPHETFAPPSLLELGYGLLEVEPSHVVVLLCLQRHADTQAVKIQARIDASSNGSRQQEAQLQPNCVALIFEHVKFRISPTTVPFLAMMFQISPLAAAEGQGEAI